MEQFTVSLRSDSVVIGNLEDFWPSHCSADWFARFFSRHLQAESYTLFDGYPPDKVLIPGKFTREQIILAVRALADELPWCGDCDGLCVFWLREWAPCDCETPCNDRVNRIADLIIWQDATPQNPSTMDTPGRQASDGNTLQGKAESAI